MYARNVALVTLGRSVEGRRIAAFVRGAAKAPTVMVLGGIHGDEPKSVYVARALIDRLRSDSGAGADVRWVVIPLVNADGYQRRQRKNARRVDINRNFPTGNWARAPKRSRMYGGSEPNSEPETRAVIKAVTRYKPTRIVAIHSIGGHRHCNNYDGPGRSMALAMSRINGYPATSSIGYPTPGSFGTWAGTEHNLATVTLELPSHHSSKRCWEDNGPALLCLADLRWRR